MTSTAQAADINVGDRVTYKDPITGRNRRGVRVVKLVDYTPLFGESIPFAVAVLSDGNRRFANTLHKVTK